VSGFRRYNGEASTLAGRMDGLLLALTILSALVVGGIAFLIVLFAVRYRRGTSASRADGPAPVRSTALEALWIGVPLVVFLGIFYWAARLYADLRTPPSDALVIDVVAKQWMWKVQHPGGQREINELHVPTGVPVRLLMTSQDVIHSFFVPAFRVKQDVLPWRYTDLWFEATRPGSYQLFCAEFCGTNHSRMGGSVIVMTQDAYGRWLAANPGPGSLAAQGEALFRSRGCSGCHRESATVHDERYIHDSILLPAKEVAAGCTGAHVPEVTLFFYLYFVMTGLHALHLFIGLGVLAIMVLLSHRGRFGPAYDTPIELTGFYWHFVDLVWIFLYPLFYLVARG
jgi:cytochrome c oxidase subunit 2